MHVKTKSKMWYLKLDGDNLGKLNCCWVCLFSFGLSLVCLFSHVSVLYWRQWRRVEKDAKRITPCVCVLEGNSVIMGKCQNKLGDNEPRDHSVHDPIYSQAYKVRVKVYSSLCFIWLRERKKNDTLRALFLE